MDAKQARELLLPIPKENFLLGKFTDDVGKCCAIGHLRRLTSKNPKDYSLRNCSVVYSGEVYDFSRRKVGEFVDLKYDTYNKDLASINNTSSVNGYNQDNPKDRVIAVLDDMIANE
jgi:hypothetical protein